MSKQSLSCQHCGAGDRLWPDTAHIATQFGACCGTINLMLAKFQYAEHRPLDKAFSEQAIELLCRHCDHRSLLMLRFGSGETTLELSAIHNRWNPSPNVN